MVQVFMLDSGNKKGGTSQVLRTTPIYLHGLKSNTTVYCKIVSHAGIQAPDRRWPDIEVRVNVGPVGRKPRVEVPDV